jgi:hypothetical protein
VDECGRSPRISKPEFGVVVWYRKASERYLTDENKSGKDEKRILEVLSKGLSTEFPNPDRVGCPGSAVLEGIASHKIPLSDAQKWLDHLGSCSPCFQEFKAIKRKLRARRGFRFGGGLAILLAAVGLWFLLRPQHTTVPNEIAVLDLRTYSSERGEPTPSNQPPLDIPRATKHLTLYLPIGSKEGSYDVALLSATGDEVLRATGRARLEDHVVVLRAEIDLAHVGSASYFLGIRQAGLEWTRFPIRVF